MKDAHTHRGHCQYCLRVLAIDVITGKLAKHGYTVKGGMFIGQCPGSDVLSLHVDRSHTDRVIVLYQERAARLAAEHADMVAGKTHPLTCKDGKPRYDTHTTDDHLLKWWAFVMVKVQIPKLDVRTGTFSTVEVEQSKDIDWADANKLQRRRAYLLKVDELDSDAKSADSFAKAMIRWAHDIHDAKVPAYRVEDLDNWAKVGDTVHAGGEKNGFDAKVEAVMMRDYTSRGFYRGLMTVWVQHVQITRPAIPDTLTKDGKRVKKAGRKAATYWEAVRNVKAAKGTLIDRLKADDLL